MDAEIIQLLGKRMEVAQEIGKYKDQSGITILQMDRWKTIFDQRVAATKAEKLSDEFSIEFIRSLHDESIRQQASVMNAIKNKKPVE